MHPPVGSDDAQRPKSREEGGDGGHVSVLSFLSFFSFSFLFFPFGKGRPAPSHVIRQMGLAGGLGSAANPLRVLRLVVLLQNPSGTALWRGPVPTGPTSVAGGKREKLCRDQRVGREERLAGSGRRNWLFFLPLFFLLLGEKGRNVRMIREIFANASGEGALFSDSESTSA